MYPQYCRIFTCAERKKKQEDNQVDKQTNKEYLTLDCPTKTESARAWRAFLDREEGLFLSKIKAKFLLKVPSLARSGPKPLKVPSLARSVPSLARSVPKPLSIFALDLLPSWL